MSESNECTHKAIIEIDTHSTPTISSLVEELARVKERNAALIDDNLGKDRVITRLAKLVLEQEHDSTSDLLTGTKSRNYFERKIRPELTRFVEDARDGLLQRAFPKNILICFIDLNGLKQINDGDGGHQIGDEAIIATAIGLTNVVRPSDTVCRYGGDEFCVIIRTEVEDPVKLQQIPINIEHRAAEIARQEFAERYFLQRGIEYPRELNFSIGTVNISDYDSFDAALKAADTLMYQNKLNKKNR